MDRYRQLQMVQSKRVLSRYFSNKFSCYWSWFNRIYFSLVSGDGSNDIHNSYFTVSGTQLLVNNADIDLEITPILNINLQVSDGFNAFAKAFTVSVTNINEAPTDISFNDTPSNDLLLHLDSGENNSYSGSGDTWKDLVEIIIMAFFKIHQLIQMIWTVWSV